MSARLPPLSLPVSCLLLFPALALAQSRAITITMVSDGAELVAAQCGGPINVWERGSGKPLALLPCPGPFRGALSRSALVTM